MKKLDFFSFLSLMVFVIGCTTLKKNEECKLYYEYLKENWYQKEEGIFWVRKKANYTDRISQQTVNVDCLVGLNKKDVKKLFGSPSVVKIDRFEYYTNKDCFSEDKAGCLRMVLIFNEKDKVDKVMPFVYEHLPKG